MPNFKHGMCKHRIYRIWSGVLTRCNNPKSPTFQRYGARGVTVIPEWKDFLTFFYWAKSAGYSGGLVIDRIDNARGYCPKNCRWVTTKQSAQNRGKRSDSTNKFKGVSSVYKSEKWRAIIRVAGKLRHLGCFDTPAEAAHAYDEAAEKFFGAFANLNFKNKI